MPTGGRLHGAPGRGLRRGRNGNRRRASPSTQYLQGIHDELENVGMTHVQAVSRPGVIHVVTGDCPDEAVIGGVVDAFETEHGPQMVSLGRVVVDHVQDDLDARLVQGLHHLLELLHLLTTLSPAGIAIVGSQETNGVVTPVVAKTAFHKVGVVDELVDGRSSTVVTPRPLR